MNRQSEIQRKTAETDIGLFLELDGTGKCVMDTGVGFLDHMLILAAKHGFMDLSLKCVGDLKVDSHHTVEDVGIVLGQAIKEALGDKKSITRYGTSFVPMDETLAMVSLDISNRPYLVFDVCFTCERIGDMQSEMVEEFFRAVAFNAGLTLHIKLVHGTNNHHIAEAVFKAFGRALNQAVTIDPRIEGVMSSKGML